MQIPTHFKGKVYFYMSEWGDVCAFVSDTMNRHGYTHLGSTEVDIKFNKEDAAARAVAGIDRLIEQERIAHRARIDTLMGQKQSFLALEHQEA